MSRSYTLAVLRWLLINVIIRFNPHTYNREGSLTCTPLYITVWSSPPSWADQQAGGVVWINRTDLGTMSLKSSILSLPAGVSPMLISINTTGRGLEVMAEQKEVVVTVRRAARRGTSVQSCPTSFLTSLQAGTSTKRLNQRKIESSSYALGMTGIASAWRWTRRYTE